MAPEGIYSHNGINQRPHKLRASAETWNGRDLSLTVAQSIGVIDSSTTLMFSDMMSAIERFPL